MNVTYTYEVVSVDQAARCMEVIYTSDGNPTMHISARLPYENETVEGIISMYAPVRYWEELKTPVMLVKPGHSGSVVVPPPCVASPTEQAVSRRNMLLTQSDWTQLPDASLTTEQRAAWAAYRQQLRDITVQPDFPTNINWPVEPGIQVTVA